MSFKVKEPPIRQKFDKEHGVNSEWVDWTNQMYKVVAEVSRSGPTANRPPKIYVGQMYFDTGLGANGMPIWVRKDGLGWIKADGTAA